MDELKFLHVHKQIADLNFHRHLSISINFLKFNSCVARKSATVWNVPSDVDVQTTSAVGRIVIPPGSPVAKKVKRKGSTNENTSRTVASTTSVSDDVVSTSTATETDDVIHLCTDIGTQTAETSFAKKQLHAMNLYMMTNIRVEELKTEPE